jgi:very-short-patch-repair endonuclease
MQKVSLDNSVGVNGVSQPLRQLARQMREDMTLAESTLWSKLRNKQLAGIKFRAQHPIERFVLDFCCISRRLAIEVD